MGKNKSGFRAYRNYNPNKTISSQNSSIVKSAFVGGSPMGGGGLGASQSLVAPPRFYSPLHTPSAWQIPTRRKEAMQWTLDNKGLMLCDDLTFMEIENLVFNRVPAPVYAFAGGYEQEDLRIEPSSIIEDYLTGGIIFEDVQSDSIFGGNGNLRQPVHISQRNCENKRFIKIKANGSYHDLRLSEEHNIFILRHNEVREHSFKHRSNRACAKRYPKGKSPSLGMKEFYFSNSWIVRKERADNVSKKDFVLTPIPKLNKPKYQHLDSDYCWMLGQALADANISKQKNKHCYTIRYNCSTNEPSTITEVKKALVKFYGRFKERQHTESEYCQQISIYSKQAYEEACVFISGKLKNKKLTKEICNLNKEQILHLLGGYFDGDGYFCNKDKNVGATTTGENLANQIYFLCLIAGISCVIRKNKLTSGISGKKKVILDDWCYTVSIPRHEISKIVPYMRSNKVPLGVLDQEVKAHNNRFFFQDSEGNTFLAQPIEAIEEFFYTGIGYDLQIDPERSYVCSGFKVSNCRFFANNEPKVAAALDFYSQFPIADYENLCDDISVKKYFDEVKRRLRVVHQCKMISYEYLCIGDVFVFCDVFCSYCNGTGVIPDAIDQKTGELALCPHEGGTFTNITVLNPDWIEVQSSYISQDAEVVVMMPDDNLKNIVRRKAPKELYDRVPPQMRALISQGRPIPLHPMCISHLAYNRVGYQPYGRSMLMRLFRTLAYKDKIVQANWMIADRLILPVRIVKVGSESFPASPQDIASVQSQLFSVSNETNVTLVVPHAFEMDFIGPAGKVLQLGKEYDMIDQELLDGLMINKALLNGEGPNWSSASIGIEAMIQRLEALRGSLAEWIEERIYRPIAIMQGFTEEDESGQKSPCYPKVKWNELKLRDDSQKKSMMISLNEKGKVSNQTLLEYFGLDPDVEVERMRLETIIAQEIGVGAPGGGEGAGGGGDLGGMLGGGAGGGMPPPPPGDMGGGGMAPPGAEAGGGAPPQASRPTTSSMPGKWSPIKRPMVSRHPITPKTHEEEVQPIPRIVLTKPEQLYYQMLKSAYDKSQIVHPCVPQYKPDKSKRYSIDFAFPTLKLGIEIDGKIWHDNLSQKKLDIERDQYLAKQGWVIWRFGEKEIKKFLNSHVYPQTLKLIRDREKELGIR